jgi:hypothetical protein
VTRTDHTRFLVNVSLSQTIYSLSSQLLLHTFFGIMYNRSDTPLLGRDSCDNQYPLVELEFDSPNPQSSLSNSTLSSHAYLIFLVRRFYSHFAVRPLGIRRSRQTLGKKSALITCLNSIVAIILGLAVVSILDALLHPSYASPPPHYQTLEDIIHTRSDTGRGNLLNEKIFIASNIIQAGLINGPWGASLIELIDLLGPQNVFVSIYENDSGLSSVEALNHLATRLDCK